MDKPLRFVPIDFYGNNKNQKKPVVVYKDGSKCRFPSVRSASRMMCVPESNIVACLKGRLKTAGGYRWEYEDGERREGE